MFFYKGGGTEGSPMKYKWGAGTPKGLYGRTKYEGLKFVS
jgi:hypothetical protein